MAVHERFRLFVGDFASRRGVRAVLNKKFFVFV